MTINAINGKALADLSAINGRTLSSISHINGQEIGASGLPVTDSFNRANDASSLGTTDTGQVWATRAGTMGINTNAAYAPALGLTNLLQAAFASVETGSADVTIEITMPTARSAISFDGILFRYVDNNNFWLARYSWQNVRVQLDLMNGASFLAAVNTAGISPPQAHDGMVMKVVLSGTAIELFIDGVSYIATTSATHQTNTEHGIVIGNNVDTVNSRLDALSIVAT